MSALYIADAGLIVLRRKEDDHPLNYGPCSMCGGRRIRTKSGAVCETAGNEHERMVFVLNDPNFFAHCLSINAGKFVQSVESPKRLASLQPSG
jgi:hypothetical protein